MVGDDAIPSAESDRRRDEWARLLDRAKKHAHPQYLDMPISPHNPILYLTFRLDILSDIFYRLNIICPILMRSLVLASGI